MRLSLEMSVLPPILIADLFLSPSEFERRTPPPVPTWACVGSPMARNNVDPSRIGLRFIDLLLRLDHIIVQKLYCGLAIGKTLLYRVDPPIVCPIGNALDFAVGMDAFGLIERVSDW